MLKRSDEEFFNVLKSIPIHGICSPYNLHSYRKTSIFVTSKCLVCIGQVYPWNEVVYCVKCQKYCHRGCMRNTEIICDSHIAKVGNDKSLLQSVQFSLLHDQNFWKNRLNEFILSHTDEILVFPKDLSIIAYLTSLLQDKDSLLCKLTEHFHNIYFVSVPNLTDKISILKACRDSLDILIQFILSKLPKKYQNETDTIMAINNLLDNYMLKLHQNQLYIYLYHISEEISIHQDEPFIVHSTDKLNECIQEMNDDDDRIHIYDNYIDTACHLCDRIINAYSGMDKLSELIQLLQYLSTLRLPPSQQCVPSSQQCAPSSSSSSSSSSSTSNNKEVVCEKDIDHSIRHSNDDMIDSVVVLTPQIRRDDSSTYETVYKNDIEEPVDEYDDDMITMEVQLSIQNIVNTIESQFPITLSEEDHYQYIKYDDTYIDLNQSIVEINYNDCVTDSQYYQPVVDREVKEDDNDVCIVMKDEEDLVKESDGTQLKNNDHDNNNDDDDDDVSTSRHMITSDSLLEKSYLNIETSTCSLNMDPFMTIIADDNNQIEYDLMTSRMHIIMNEGSNKSTGTIEYEILKTSSIDKDIIQETEDNELKESEEYAETEESKELQSIPNHIMTLLQWLPSDYLEFIQSRIEDFQVILKDPEILLIPLKSNIETIKSNVWKATLLRAHSGEKNDDVSIEGNYEPISTEILIHRLRYVLLYYLQRQLSTKNRCVTWHTEVTYISNMVPEGEWLLGASGYALATLYTALK